MSTPSPTYKTTLAKKEYVTATRPICYQGTLGDFMRKGHEIALPVTDDGKVVQLKEINFTVTSNSCPVPVIVKSEHEYLNTQMIRHESQNSSSHAQLSCMSYIHTKTPKRFEQRDIIWTRNLTDIRNKLEKFPIITSVREEFDAYRADHKAASNEPATSKEYLNSIVRLANKMKLSDIDKTVEVVYDKSGAEFFEINRTKNEKFQEFLNMTYVDGPKRFLGAPAQVGTQKFPGRVLGQAKTLVKNIRHAIGVVNAIDINLQPVLPLNFDVETYILDRIRKKGNELVTVFINMEVKYSHTIDN